MHLSTTEYVAWILSPILHLCIAAIMYRRSLVREYPWFFVYVIFHIVQFGLLFLAFQVGYAPYFYLYWAVEAIDWLLALAVIQEIYEHAFRPFDGLTAFSALAFKCGAIVLVAISFGMAFASDGSERNWMIAALLTLDRSAAFVQFGLLILVFLLKQAVGLNWRRSLTGIALGMSVLAASEAVALTVRTYSTTVENATVRATITFSNMLGIFVWLTALLLREPQPDRAELSGEDVLRKWNSALIGIIER